MCAFALKKEKLKLCLKIMRVNVLTSKLPILAAEFGALNVFADVDSSSYVKTFRVKEHREMWIQIARQAAYDARIILTYEENERESVFQLFITQPSTMEELERLYETMKASLKEYQSKEISRSLLETGDYSYYKTPSDKTLLSADNTSAVILRFPERV